MTLGIGKPIRGRVQLEDGKPADNIQVYLRQAAATSAVTFQPSNGATIGYAGTIYVATAVTDDQGNLAIRGVAPGIYSLNSEPNGQEVSAPPSLSPLD